MCETERSRPTSHEERGGGSYRLLIIRISLSPGTEEVFVVWDIKEVLLRHLSETYSFRFSFR